LTIKLIDFGVATRFDKNGLTGLTGTPSYVAPEVITGKYNEKYYAEMNLKLSEK